jgi:hypothetical protein
MFYLRGLDHWKKKNLQANIFVDLVFGLQFTTCGETETKSDMLVILVQKRILQQIKALDKRQVLVYPLEC